MLFDSAVSAALGPVREENNLLSGRTAQDILLRHWRGGKDATWDVTITSPLAPSHVAGAAKEAGGALRKACLRKADGAADACREQGIVFLPLALEALGGLHKTAVQQMRLLLLPSSPVRRSLSPPPIYSKGTHSTAMFTTRGPDDGFPQAVVDGVI